MRLLSIGRGVRIVGSDIGPRLLSIMRKLGNESLDRQGMLDAIDEWLEFKLARDSKTAEDTAACMRVFARQGSNLGQAIAYADHLFKQHGSIQLLTGHKSKGLEFPLVYHLDPHLIGEGRQDKNIRYVIGTRSSNEYYEIRSDEIQW
jgi:ATP-dependent exoDNAse (exonuclease V) beta subunit